MLHSPVSTPPEEVMKPAEEIPQYHSIDKKSFSSSPLAPPPVISKEEEDIWEVIDKDFVNQNNSDPDLHKSFSNTFEFEFGKLGKVESVGEEGRQEDEKKSTINTIPKCLQRPYGTTSFTPSTQIKLPHDTELPLKVQSELIDLYFQYSNSISCYIIQENVFRKQLKDGKVPSGFLLYCMYALAARYSGNELVCHDGESSKAVMKKNLIIFNLIQGDKFYAKARNLISQLIDVPTIETVLGLILLVTYSGGSGRGSASWMYCGMAIRMAQALKLDIDPSHPDLGLSSLSWRKYEIERRKRIWWVIFIMDRYHSAVADRPIIIQDDDINVGTPCSDEIWNGINDEFDEFETGVDDHSFLKHIQLTRIFGKATDYVHTVKSGVTVSEDSDHLFDDIRSQLLSWHANQQDHHSSYLSLFYQMSIIFLNRPKLTAAQQSNSDVVNTRWFLDSKKAADEATCILQNINEKNKEFKCFTPMMCFFIFQVKMNFLSLKLYI